MQRYYPPSIRSIYSLIKHDKPSHSAFQSPNYRGYIKAAAEKQLCILFQAEIEAKAKPDAVCIGLCFIVYAFS